MIIFLSEKQVRSNLTKFSWKSFDKTVYEKLNESVYNYVHHQMAKVMRKHKNIEKLGAEHFSKTMNGGRTVLPLEYFGVSTNHYNGVLNNGTDMAVTDMNIRPAFAALDTATTTPLPGPKPLTQAGGKVVFKVSESAIKGAVSEVLTKLGKDVHVKHSAVKLLKENFEELVTGLLDKACKKSREHLSASEFMDVYNMKKFSCLQKK